MGSDPPCVLTCLLAVKFLLKHIFPELSFGCHLQTNWTWFGAVTISKINIYEDLVSNICSNFIWNGQKLEITQVYINKQRNKQIMLDLQNIILLSNIKK